MDERQLFQVYFRWCVMRGRWGLRPHQGLLLLSVASILDACLCLCMFSDGTLDLGIQMTASCRGLLWQDLSRFHDGCTEVAGSPVELW